MEKLATIYVLNVNHQMSLYPDKAFSKCVQVITNRIKERCLTNRKVDLYSVLLAGTRETVNVVNEKFPDQYLNISTLRDLARPDLELLKKVVNTTTESEDVPAADMLDAAITAHHMLEERCKKLKFDKRIVMFTDCKKEIDWRDLEPVCEMFTNYKVELELIGVDYDELSMPNCPPVIKENYKHWTRLSKESLSSNETALVLSIHDALALSEKPAVKEIGFRPVYSGYLLIGKPDVTKEFLAINIQMFLRTKEVKAPSTKKVSAISEGSSRAVYQEPKFVYEESNGIYMDEDSSETVLDKTDFEKGYKFGKTIVKVSDEELAYAKIKTLKEMTIIGFVSASEFPRHYLYSNAFVISEGTRYAKESGKVLQALILSLHTTGMYALVRYVHKDDQDPHIGVLVPDIESSDVAVLLYFSIPFADDTRDYQFKSINEKETSNDNIAVDLMDQLVDSMSLGPLFSETEEHTSMDHDLKSTETVYLKPEETFNPIIWRTNEAIHLRALNEMSLIPELPDIFLPQFEIKKEFQAKATQLGEKINSHFNIKKVEEKKKRRIDYGEDDVIETGNSGTQDINDLMEAARIDASTGLNTKMPRDTHSASGTPSGNLVDRVGITTPIQDFNAMLDAPSEIDMVGPATQQMSEVILKLLEISFGTQNFKKAIECMKVFRKAAAKEDAAVEYNKCAKKVKVWCDLVNTSSPRRDMWEMMKKEKLGLVTNKECEDVDNVETTETVAEEFWSEKDVIKSTPKPAEDGSDEEYDMDDLEDLL